MGICAVCDSMYSRLARRSRTRAQSAPEATAYVSIRQHTSACVSIRQHTSATSAYQKIAHESTAIIANTTPVHIQPLRAAVALERLNQGYQIPVCVRGQVTGSISPDRLHTTSFTTSFTLLTLLLVFLYLRVRGQSISSIFPTIR
jgi:hypothetical protein